MRRVPVVQVIRDAYAFAFGHLGGIIGLIWIPMVLVTVAQFFTLWRYYNAMIDYLAGGNAAALGPAVLMLLGDAAATILLYAMMFTAVVQLVLGSRGPGTIAHFAFGHQEWRMARALLACAGLLLLFLLGFALLLNVILAMGKLSQNAAGLLMLLGLGTVGLVLAPRLLLLPAVAVSETVPVLRRVLTLAEGNYLRLLAVLLALVVPLSALVWAANMSVAGGMVLTGNDQVQMMQTLLAGRQSLPLACGVGFFVSPVLVGLLASGSVSVWRALTGERALDVTV